MLITAHRAETRNDIGRKRERRVFHELGERKVECQSVDIGAMASILRPLLKPVCSRFEQTGVRAMSGIAPQASGSEPQKEESG